MLRRGTPPIALGEGTAGAAFGGNLLGGADGAYQYDDEDDLDDDSEYGPSLSEDELEEDEEERAADAAARGVLEAEADIEQIAAADGDVDVGEGAGEGVDAGADGGGSGSAGWEPWQWQPQRPAAAGQPRMRARGEAAAPQELLQRLGELGRGPGACAGGGAAGPSRTRPEAEAGGTAVEDAADLLERHGLEEEEEEEEEVLAEDELDLAAEGGQDDAEDEEEGEGEEEEEEEEEGGDSDHDIDSYVLRPPGEVLQPDSRLARLYAALETNQALQRQLSSALERLDEHSNTSYTLERRVRQEPIISRPHTMAARMRAITQPRLSEMPNVGAAGGGAAGTAGAAAGTAAGAAAAAAAGTSRLAAAAAAAAAGAPQPPTSRFWRVGLLLPPPTAEFERLAAVQQLPPRPYDRVRWPQRVVDALNKGLTLEVQSILTRQLLERLQQHTQQRQQAATTAQQGAGGGSGAGGAGGGAGTSGGAGAPADGAGGVGADAGGSGGGGGTAGGEINMQAEYARIQAVRPDSPEAVPLILQLDEAAWARVAAAHRVGRSGAECAAYYRQNLRPGLQWPLEESRRLMELADKYNQRQWHKVAEELGTGRTAGQCLAHCLRWSRFDRRPQRSAWTGEDDALLQALVGRLGTNWVAVSEGFGGRFDRHQVRDRWHAVMTAAGPRRTGKWTSEEDALLHKAVEELGRKWKEVSQRVPGRTAQQCRERFVNLLSPELRFGVFSEEETKTLVAACAELQAAYGRITWSRVAERLPGRTDDQCKRAYEGLVKHNQPHVGHMNGTLNYLERPQRGRGRARARGRGSGGGDGDGDVGPGGGQGGRSGGLGKRRRPGGSSATDSEGDGAAGGHAAGVDGGEQEPEQGQEQEHGGLGGAAAAGTSAAAAGLPPPPQRRPQRRTRHSPEAATAATAAAMAAAAAAEAAAAAAAEVLDPGAGSGGDVAGVET
ncbi:hypothetical protein HYH02_004455 [Chlamydomonas schloesseri]|uniref:Uncharacterized protein n=1 Tax=Chlamydomonas schloesseri TaxID=2026947 RepID=A0A835WQ23_9CHLO|nr:hypothetical protein HYH02_004455 [Chlamydomonas schloesseri]|eukprot:KAG2450615.1 hypothetical protein HYH02_004455 [Chlamydomonas schloesseri]